jgi:HD-GYP domain-containing protein (c-di-GMP phosphodiesterase class II)
MPLTDSVRLKELIQLAGELSQVQDLNILLESILKKARVFTGCDAGSIYIRRDNVLEFSHAQNDTLQRLEPHRKLIYTTFNVPIDSYSITGHVAKTGEMVNIPDVYELSDTVPYTFNRQFDERSYYSTRSMLTVPLKSSIGDTVGVLQLINALDEHGHIVSFPREVEPYVTYFAGSAANAIERAMLTRNVVMRMIRMTELRDPNETGNHVRRVGGYALEVFETLARRQGMSAQEVTQHRDILHMAAMLHDVGKAAIPDIILTKPGRLTAEEFQTIKQHTIAGGKLLSDPFTTYERAAQEVALNHHERWDGSGYPGHVDPSTGRPIPGRTDRHGLPLPKREDEIPLMGRIVAIADVYDALLNRRVYKDAWEQDQVLAYLWDQRGGHFDPDIVDAFFDSLLSITAVTDRFTEEMNSER